MRKSEKEQILIVILIILGFFTSWGLRLFIRSLTGFDWIGVGFMLTVAFLIIYYYFWKKIKK